MLVLSLESKESEVVKDGAAVTIKTVVRRPVQPHLNLGGHRYRDVSIRLPKQRWVPQLIDRRPGSAQTIHSRFGPGGRGDVDVDGSGRANFVDQRARKDAPETLAAVVPGGKPCQVKTKQHLEARNSAPHLPVNGAADVDGGTQLDVRIPQQWSLWAQTALPATVQARRSQIRETFSKPTQSFPLPSCVYPKRPPANGAPQADYLYEFYCAVETSTRHR